MKKLEKHLEKRVGAREGDLGGEETEVSRERSRKMKVGSHRTFI